MGKDGGMMVEKTIFIDKEVAFGTGTFYKQNQELVDDQVEVGFGNAKIYYDNAEILGDTATLKVEVGFGNAVIYVITLSSFLQGNWKIFLFNVDNSQLSKSHISTDNQSFTGWS